MPTPYKRFLSIYDAPLARTSTSFGLKTLTGAAGAVGAANIITATGFIAAGVLFPGAAIAAAGGTVLVALPLACGLAKATLWRKDRRSASEKGRNLSNDDFDDPMQWDCYWTTVVVVGWGK